MISQSDKADFDIASTVLEEATRELIRFQDDPGTPELTLAKAQRRYEQARFEWLYCHFRLRAAGVGTNSVCPLTYGTIVGSNAHVSESISLLLKIRRSMHMITCDFERWYDDPSWALPQLVIVDVAEPSVEAALWFFGSLAELKVRPYTIAMTWPDRLQQFSDRSDAVVRKPLVFGELLQVVDNLSARLPPSAETSAPGSSVSFPDEST